MILLVLAAIVTGAPIAAALLVTIASLREDAEQSFSGRAPGPLTATARRLLAAGGRRTIRPRERAPRRDDITRPLTGPKA
jgi:hypothetical protein